MCLQPFGLGKADHLAIFPDALLDGLALVFLAKRVARHHYAAGFVDPALVAVSCCQSAQHAALVQAQADIGNVATVGQARDYLFGVCHLRYAPRMDKAGHFHATDTGSEQAIDQSQLI